MATKISVSSDSRIQNQKSNIKNQNQENKKKALVHYTVWFGRHIVQSQNGLICIWNPWQNRVVVAETEQMRMAKWVEIISKLSIHHLFQLQFHKI